MNNYSINSDQSTAIAEEAAQRREVAAAKIKENLVADKQNYARTIKKRNLVRLSHVALSLIALTLSIGLVVSTLPILIAMLWVTIMLQPVAPAVTALRFFDANLTNQAKSYQEDYIGPYIEKLTLVAGSALAAEVTRSQKLDIQELKDLLTDQNAFANQRIRYAAYDNICKITFSPKDADQLAGLLMQILNDAHNASKIAEIKKSGVDLTQLKHMIKDSQAIRVVIKDMLRRGAEKDSVQQLN